MCEELKEELENGNKAMKLLVEHLEAMCADKLTQHIETELGCYIVEVRKTL